MLTKPNWQTISIMKHLLISVILLNYMFQFGTADSNNDEINLNKIEQASNNEQRYLIEFEEQLKKGDYVQAKLNADLIRNNDKVIDVMKKVYETEKDIDGYLYFTGIVNDLSRRLLIFEYIYNDIILKRDFKPAEQHFWIHRVFMVYSSINLWSKVENTILKVAPETSDIYSSAKNLTDSIKQRWFKESISDRTENHVIIDDIAKDTYYLTNDYEHTRVNVTIYVDLIKGNIIDSGFDINILLDNQNKITSLTMPLNDINELSKCNQNLRSRNMNLDFQALMMVVYLKNKAFDLVLDTYNYLESDNEQKLMAIKEFYHKFHDVDSILNFTDLLKTNDQVMVYNALYDAINKTEAVNICDMLKLHNGLVKFTHSNKLLTIINNLKNFITLAIKKDLIQNFPDTFNPNNYFNFVESNYNNIGIQSKDDNTIIGYYKYYLAKENLKKENNESENCYFNIEISRNNYENWFWKSGINSSLKFNNFLDIITKHKKFMDDNSI